MAPCMILGIALHASGPVRKPRVQGWRGERAAHLLGIDITAEAMHFCIGSVGCGAVLGWGHGMPHPRKLAADGGVKPILTHRL